MKKLLSVFLSVLMVFSLVQTCVFAVDPPEGNEGFIDMKDLILASAPAEFHWDFSEESARTWETAGGGYRLKYENDMLCLNTDYEAYAGTPYIQHVPVSLDTSDYRYLVFRLRNMSDATQFYMYYATTTHPAMSEENTFTVSILPQNESFIEYVVDMTQLPGWSGDYTSCMLVCHKTGNGVGKGEIDFKDIYFTSDYYKDDLYHYPLHTSPYTTPYPLAGVPGHKSYMGGANTRIFEAAGVSDGYIEFPAPTETVQCKDYKYFVIKSLNTPTAFKEGILDYFETTVNPKRGPLVGSFFTTGDSGIFNYHIIELATNEAYKGELRGGMLVLQGAGSMSVVDMFLTNNSDFLHNETGVEPTTFTLLAGSGKIDTVDGVINIVPELRYADGTVETDYSTVVWETDGIYAIPTVNSDHSLMLCGKNNGKVKVKATMKTGATEYTSEITVPVTNQPPRKLSKTVKLMTYGNSITYHPANDSLEWYNNCGMAASGSDKDYVHQLTKLLKERYGADNVIQYYGDNASSFEAQINTADENTDWSEKLAGVTECVSKNTPDIVVLQYGENCSLETTTATYKKALGALVNAVKAGNPDAVVVITLPWWSYGAIGNYLGAKALAEERNLPLADLSTLAFDRDTNWADQTVYTQYAVYSHPGDKGMENIAKEFYRAMKPYLVRDLDSKLTFSASPESVKITTAVHTISEEGGSLALEASVLPADAAQELVYASSDENVVTVDDDGVMTAVFNGSATITVSSAYDASVKATFNVTVTGQKGPFTVTYHKNTTDTVDNMPADNAWAIGEYTEDTIPVRAAYRFMGWALSADGEVKDEFDITKDTDLYAIWEKAYRWDFERTGDKEGFTIEHGFNQYVEDGVFRAMATYTDEAAGNVLTVNSPALSLDSRAYNRLVITLQNSTITDSTKLRLTVNTDKGSYNYTKPITQTDMVTYQFDLSDAAGTITGFSFIPVDIDCSVLIDEIYFEGAGVSFKLDKALLGVMNASKMTINGTETAMTDGAVYEVKLTDGVGTVCFDGTKTYSVTRMIAGGGCMLIGEDITVAEFVFDRDDGTAVAAAYDADGRLIAAKTASLADTDYVLIDAAKAASLKAFVFEDTASLKVAEASREVTEADFTLPETDGELSAEAVLFAKVEPSAEASLLAAARPGVNVYTDSLDVLTFENAAEASAFTATDGSISVSTSYSSQTRSNALYVNAPGGGEAYFQSSFGKSVNAPVLMYAHMRLDRMGVRFNGTPFYCDYWDHIGVGLYSANDYTVCRDNTETFDPSVTYTGWTSVIWYDTGSALIDDLAIIPFYRITYDVPGTGDDIVEYYLTDDGSTVRVSDGVITGLAESYTVRDDISYVKANATMLGWSTDPAATEPMTSVPLSGENITLYPVFVTNDYRPGTNVYTGTAKAVSFDDEDDAALFYTADGQTSAEIIVNGYSPLVGGSNTCLKIRSSASAQAGEAYYLKSKVVPVGRPCVMLFDAVLNYHVFFVDGIMSGSTGYAENEIIRMNRTLGDYRELKLSAFTFNPGAEWFFDNYAVVPFYQVIYDMPDGEEDIVLYFLGEDEDGNTSLAVSADGTITGLPTEYPIDEWIVPETEDKVFLGWSASKGSLTPDADGLVPLDGSDITLYPVYETEGYPIFFDTGDRNTTVADMVGHDDVSVTLPTVGDVTAWKLCGTDKTYAPGEEMLLSADDIKNITYAGGLHMEAIYDDTVELTPFNCDITFGKGQFEGASELQRKYLSYVFGAGIIGTSETFEDSGKVTLLEVLKAAAAMYNKTHGIGKSYASDKELLEDMISVGVAWNIADLAETATVLDAVRMCANAVAANQLKPLSYDTLAYLDSADAGYGELQKLYRAGVVDDTVSVKASLTNGVFLSILAKIVAPSFRSNDGCTVYVLGDSLCAFNDVNGAMGWPRKHLDYWDESIGFVNYSRGGIDTHCFFTYEEDTSKYAAMMSTIRPGDYVLIALGTNDSTLWSLYGTEGYVQLRYEDSRDYYHRYIEDVLAAGATPILVCPAGRNTTDTKGNYIESDPDIINCMKDANTFYGTNAPIINIKDKTLPLYQSLSAIERNAIYHDDVHTTDYGAGVVCKAFSELVDESDDFRLGVLKNHLLVNREDPALSTIVVNAPVTSDVTSFRTDSKPGLRFTASVDASVREILDAEYGFLVSTEKLLGNTPLTAECGKPFVKHVNFNEGDGIDEVFGVVDDGAMYRFSAVLYDFPKTKESYTTSVVIRSYVKVGDVYFYGDVLTDTVYDAAKRIPEEMVDETPFLAEIISLCED